MRAFPCQYRLAGEQKIFRYRHFFRDIDNTRWANKTCGRNGIECIIAQVFTRHPMHGGIEMGSGVFADGDGIPIPARPFIVIARNFVHAKTGRGRKNRRQANHRGFGAERLGQINHFDAPIAHLFY